MSKPQLRALGLAMVVMGTVVQGAGAGAPAPTIDLALNLRYNDPADPSEGGSWQLVAKTDSPFGISAINAYLSNIDLAGITYGNGGAVTAATIGAELTPGNDVWATALGGGFNVLYFQDTANGPIVGNVGGGAGTPGNIANDALFNPAWHNTAAIVKGTFGASRPAFITVGANATDGNTLPSANTTPPVFFSLDANVTTRVRGDSVLFLGLNAPADSGLLPGDATRDFFVSGNDLNLVLLNYNTVGKTWSQGDFNDSVDGAVNGDDLALILLNYNRTSTPPASVAAAASVPEPATAVLLLAASAGIGVAARRRTR